MILHTLGDRVPDRLKSGGQDLTRSMLKGTQEFDTDKTLWPVNKAVPKLEAQIQTSGMQPWRYLNFHDKQRHNNFIRFYMEQTV